MLEIYDVILRVIADLKAYAKALERFDPDLARQMRRAMTSVALNVAEGMGSRGRNRNARYHTALGSMRETLACVDVGVALGYVEPLDDRTLDPSRRVVGTLVRLVRA